MFWSPQQFNIKLFDNNGFLNFFQTWSRVHITNALTGKLWNCMGSWFKFLKQIFLTWNLIGNRAEFVIFCGTVHVYTYKCISHLIIIWVDLKFLFLAKSMKHTMINYPFISNLSLSRKVQLQGFKGALVEKVLYVHTFMHIRSIFIRKYSYNTLIHVQ